MGAFFNFAITQLPTFNDGKTIYCITDHPDGVEELEKRAETLTRDRLLDMCSIIWGEDDAEDDRLDEMSETIKGAIDVLNSNRRDVGTLLIDKRVYLLTGGMTWSDDPTEALTPIQILEMAGITEEPLDLISPNE